MNDYPTQPQLGLSNNKAEAKEFVRLYSNYIFANLGYIPKVRRVIDWGVARGQGKRSGGMIKGAMCSLMGPTQYEGVDLSSFNELDEMSIYLLTRDAHAAARYAGAFNGGCNHLEAMTFALRPNITL
jgi:hypothetical protein